MVTERTGLLAASVLFFASTPACSDDPAPGPVSPKPRDATAVGDDQGAAASVVCCPPSPQPNCCMDYGGAQTHGA
ncbi:MAG: hypothetical protein RLZZ450_5764, partial [Pseudomonadota bacterium]